MSLRKYASLENVQVLELKGSATRARHASLGKLADFENYRTEDGYLYARISAISSRVNKNHDGWPSIELAGGQDIFDRHFSSTGFTVTADSSREYGFSTFLGKPIFVDHHNSDPERARGVVVDATFHVDDHKTSSLDSYYSSPDVDPEHLPPCSIELLLEVDAKSFPKFAKAIVEGGRNPKKGIDGWSMGCDVEKSVCSICKNAASAPDEYCTHIKMKGANFDYINKRGQKTSRKAYENCYGVKFFEISGVFDPADETALSREVRSHTSSYQHDWDPTGEHQAGFDQYLAKKEKEEEEDTVPPKETLKGLADDVNDAYLEESGEEHLKRKKKSDFDPLRGAGDNRPGRAMQCPGCHGAGGNCPMCSGRGYFAPQTPGSDDGLAHTSPPEVYQEYMPGEVGGPDFDYDYGPARQGKTAMQDMEWSCPGCGYSHWHEGQEFADGTPGDTARYCSNCGQPDTQGIGMDGAYSTDVHPDTVSPGGQTVGLPFPVERLGPVRNGHMKTAANPLPQSEMLHAPESVDTLREEETCPICGSSMDEDTCDVCAYQKEPEGFDNPDLTKAKDVDLPGSDQPPGELTPTEPQKLDGGAEQNTNTPTNPTALAHVTSDMGWDIPKTSARINKVERPVVATDRPATNEPKEKILSDQLKPVTSRVRTARDFIAAVDTTKRNTMDHTAEAASGAPAVAKPDVRTDVTGVGGVDQASNDAASKADAQIDVTGIGETGTASVSADQEGVNVDQGDEHSKNVESIPTMTWSDGKGDSLGQQDPVTREPFPASEDGVHATSNWHISYDDAPFPNEEINGGGAVRGVKPVAEQFGDRVDVLDHVTSPSNNSGPTKTWSGTDGNGVLKQQDPVTNESIALGESGIEGAPNWTSSTHIFTAFKLARTEVQLGMISGEQEFARAAELEKESPTVLAASLAYAQRVKTARQKVAGTKKLPVMGRTNEEKVAEEKIASTEPETTEDDSFMFGGV